MSTKPARPARASGLDALPTRDDEGRWLAVIEATQGTRHKFKYHAGSDAFVLSGVLPLGLGFPYDFGFLPSTLGDDGDPLDVLVLADEALPLGALAPVRIVGVIEAEQQEKGGRAERNDRLLAVTDPSHRYLLVEVADECRHSTMFGEYIRRAGTPAYGPSGIDDIDLTTLPGGRAMGYLLILAIEELLDVCNRATMRDETVHPLSRQIARIHVLEEARHVSFAKAYLAEAWPELTDAERMEASAIAPIAVELVANLMVDDAVAETLGIPGGGDAARANPHHRTRIVNDLAKLVDFLTELGVIDATNRHEWTTRGLATV